jgi:hypothetical protein
VITTETRTIAPRGTLIAEWLVPSLSDILFAALLVWLILFTIHSDGSIGLLADSNTGYHIRTGDFILRHGAAPHRDIFSFSKAGEPWFAWEWLSAILFALLYQAAGMKGLVIMSAAVIAVANVILLRHMVWRGANFLAVIVILHFGIGASSIHYLARPHIFTLLFLAISLWLIDVDRRQPTARIWILVPLAALWVNLHGGFLALIASLGIVAAGSVLEAAWWKTSWSAPCRYALLTLACLAATGLNPYGFSVHRHAIQFLTQKWLAALVQEYQPTSFHSTEALYFEALLFMGIALTAWLVAEKQLASALLIFFWAHAALSSMRHIPIYVFVVAPMLGQQSTALWNRWTVSARRGSLPAILHAVAKEHTPGLARTTLWAPALLVLLTLFRLGWDWPDDFPSQRFPVAMTQRHADRIATARIFTTDAWADYLTFRNYPRQRIFFDGRSDFFGKSIADEYMQVLNGQYGWDSTVKRRAFDAALVPPQSAIASLLRLEPDWRLVEQDDQAVLFEKGNAH